MGASVVTKTRHRIALVLESLAEWLRRPPATIAKERYEQPHSIVVGRAHPGRQTVIGLGAGASPKRVVEVLPSRKEGISIDECRKLGWTTGGGGPQAKQTES